MPNLTDLAIKTAAPPASGTVTLWDSSLKGFGVRISAKGAKTFIVLIGSGRRQKIGRYPLISLADARTEAKRILAEKQLGKVRPTFTAFNDARDEYLADCEKRLRPLTVKVYRRYLAVHFPFARKSVGDITGRDIIKRLKNLPPSEKEHAHRAGRTFFKWCVHQHLIERSPMENMEKPKAGKSRERVLSDDELKAVYKAARAGQSPFHRLVCLLIHTGQRKGEMSRLEWSWVSKGRCTLPAEVTKNGRKHALPLGEATAKLLGTFPRLNDSPYVFPAARSHVNGKATTTISGFSEAKRDFDIECGVTGWTLHDLRRTFATGLQKLGIRLEVTEAILNHVSGSRAGVVGVYQRYDYFAEMKAAMAAWERHLQSLASN